MTKVEMEIGSKPEIVDFSEVTLFDYFMTVVEGMECLFLKTGYCHEENSPNAFMIASFIYRGQICFTLKAQTPCKKVKKLKVQVEI